MSVEDERAMLISRAKLAEQMERYNDMANAMKKVVELGSELSNEERNLLSVAYKNVVGTRRSSARVISSIGEKTDSSSHKHGVAVEYNNKIQSELKKICHDVLELLTKYLIDSGEAETDSRVFYYKMKGDYYRYLAEVGSAHEADEKDPKKEAEKAYKKAEKMAGSILSSTNPIRLGVALNYSVFLYEIKDTHEEACELAKKAYGEAIQELNTLEDESYKDSTLIMQLLRDNLTLWMSEEADEVPDN